VKVELSFIRKGFPPAPPTLLVKIEGDRQAVEKVLAAVRKTVEEELTDLEESACVGR